MTRFVTLPDIIGNSLSTQYVKAFPLFLFRSEKDFKRVPPPKLTSIFRFIRLITGIQEFTDEHTV